MRARLRSSQKLRRVRVVPVEALPYSGRLVSPTVKPPPVHRPSTTTQRIVLAARGDSVEQGPPRRGTDGLREDLARQLTLMAHRSTPYRRLVPQIVQLIDDPQHGPAVLASMQRAWRNREFRAFYERPLLLFAAMRSDALGDGASHPLHAALRDSTPDADAITEASVRSALDASRTGLWTTLGLRRVQTNDTSRGLAWLWPAAIAGCSDGARPLLLVDVGCSAGLNLTADALPHLWTKASGGPLGMVVRPQVVGRFGLDERPLDVSRADDARWLHACVWPGETQRLKRLDAAIAAFRAAGDRRERVDVARRHAAATPSLVRTATAGVPDNTLVIVYQTMMSGYLDAESRRSFEDGLHHLVVSSAPGSVLWVDLDVTGPSTSPRPAELWVHARSGEQRVSFLIGTMGYHPSEIGVRDDAVRDLAALLRSSP